MFIIIDYGIYSNMIQSHCFSIGHFLGENKVTAPFVLSDWASLSFLIQILHSQKCTTFECYSKKGDIHSA